MPELRVSLRHLVHVWHGEPGPLNPKPLKRGFGWLRGKSSPSLCVRGFGFMGLGFQGSVGVQKCAATCFLPLAPLAPLALVLGWKTTLPHPTCPTCHFPHLPHLLLKWGQVRQVRQVGQAGQVRPSHKSASKRARIEADLWLGRARASWARQGAMVQLWLQSASNTARIEADLVRAHGVVLAPAIRREEGVWGCHLAPLAPLAPLMEGKICRAREQVRQVGQVGQNQLALPGHQVGQVGQPRLALPEKQVGQVGQVGQWQVVVAVVYGFMGVGFRA